MTAPQNKAKATVIFGIFCFLVGAAYATRSALFGGILVLLAVFIIVFGAFDYLKAAV